MKRFTGFKILLSIMLLLFFVQLVAAEQIIVPSTDSDGVSWTAPTTGTYRFTYTGGAVRGPDYSGSGPTCGTALPGLPPWSNELYLYKNRDVGWGGSCYEPDCCKPDNPDYRLGDGNYFTFAEAEAAAMGTYFEIPLVEGDRIILLCPDFSNAPWSQNSGNYYIEVRIPVVPDISGTWSGTYNNVGVEQYSSEYTITQNVDQISGTAAFVITSSNYAPQDVGKSFTYNFQGTIDENGNFHITGNVATAPPEIYSRCGAWDYIIQLSADGNTISYYGGDQYGNVLEIVLHRQNQPPIANLPGYINPPTDPDGDGIYEDLNANGRLDFADVVLYFNQMTWIAANEPIAAFDLNGNGRIDFADIVALFNEI